jgi:hypothetical protein
VTYTTYDWCACAVRLHSAPRRVVVARAEAKEKKEAKPAVGPPKNAVVRYCYRFTSFLRDQLACMYDQAALCLAPISAAVLGSSS